MRSWHTILEPGDVQQAALQVNLIPPQGDKFADPQPMTVGEEDQRSVPVSMASEARSGLHQLLNFGRGEVLPCAALAVGQPTGRSDFPVFGSWRMHRDGPQMRVVRRGLLFDFPENVHFRHGYSAPPPQAVVSVRPVLRIRSATLKKPVSDAEAIEGAVGRMNRSGLRLSEEVCESCYALLCQLLAHLNGVCG